ncbi:lipopolysaccharide heptosyltransferase II [soil metagenome]
MRDTTLNFQNILVINFGQLGDVVLSLPALAAIRQRYPAAHIAVITGKVPDQVVKMSGLADEVIMVDRVELRDGPKLRSISKILKFVGEIRRRHIDIVIDLHSLSETNILAFLSKAKYRLLANRESRSLDRLSNFRPSPPKEDKAKPLADRYLDVLLPLDISGGDKNIRLQISQDDAEFVGRKYFADSTRTAGLFPGAGHPSRCWDLDNFKRLAVKFVADEVRPAVILGPEEAGMRGKVEEVFPKETVIIDGLTIPQFIAAAARLDVFVTNDTGPMHLAAVAGAPIVLLLDGRAPTTYLPLTDRLEVVRADTIDQIKVDTVYAAAAGVLARSNIAENDKAALP